MPVSVMISGRPLECKTLVSVTISVGPLECEMSVSVTISVGPLECEMSVSVMISIGPSRWLAHCSLKQKGRKLDIVSLWWF